MIELVKTFLRPAFIGAVSGLVGIASGINSLTSDGGGGAPAPAGGAQPGSGVYVPSGLGSADVNWQQLLTQLIQQQSGVSGQVDPVLQESFKNVLGINQAPLIQAGQTAGQEFAGTADLGKILSQLMLGQGAGDIAQQTALRGAAFDPQQALYDRTLQQIQEQSRQSASAYGVGQSPYAAGLENQAVGNFNIDWLNNQLKRMIAGGDAASRTGQFAGADISSGMQFAQGVPGATLASAQTPIAAQQTAFGAPAQAGVQFGQNMAGVTQDPMMAIMSQILPYLFQGSGASANAATALLGQNQFGAGQKFMGASGLAQGLNQLSTQANTPGSWLSGLWGGSNPTASGMQMDPSQFAFEAGTGQFGG
jgi:hypothetical protein